jgi:CRP-like cAMP-binding protein
MDIRSLFKGTKGSKRFKAGKTIFKEGTVGDLMYVVLDGSWRSAPEAGWSKSRSPAT